MSGKKDLSLSPRKEEVRDVKSGVVPVRFSLKRIYEHFSESLKSVEKQYEVADSLVAGGNTDDGKTIWRSQVVLAEGLLDFYIHEMSKYCLFRMFIGERTKSEKYANIMIPLGKVEEGLYASQSNEWFFSYLNDRFSHDVFLSKESMRDQLNLIGIEFVRVMSTAFPRKNDQESANYGAKVVSDLFQRRNEIAHQNDRSHASAEQTDISKEFVEDYISKIKKIVIAMYEIAEEKEKSE